MVPLQQVYIKLDAVKRWESAFLLEAVVRPLTRSQPFANMGFAIAVNFTCTIIREKS